MDNLLPLVRNETIKLVRKKRFLVIVLILLVLIPLFTYAQLQIAQNNKKQFGTTDWRKSVQQQIYDYTNRLGSARVPDEWKQWLRVQVQVLQYYLDHNVDPKAPNAVTFVRYFYQNTVSLFIPLMVLAVASDLVSGERSGGTIKMLLTRPVRRWKVLTSKLIAMGMFVSLIVLLSGLFAYVISGIVFGYGGWDMPIFTGFQITGTDNVDTTQVHAVSMWFYLLMQSGLVWFSAMCVGCMAMMVSVLVRSTAASFVIMMATLISGIILSEMASSWNAAKYFFMVNLSLTDYLAGMLPPIVGMTLPFSMTILAIWTLVSLIVSYVVFTRQDILH